MLRETFEVVAVVNPRFHDFGTAEQKIRIAKSFGVAEPGIKSVIIVVNLGHHWSAFVVSLHKRRCFLFIPMHLPSNISTIKESCLLCHRGDTRFDRPTSVRCHQWLWAEGQLFMRTVVRGGVGIAAIWSGASTTVIILAMMMDLGEFVSC